MSSLSETIKNTNENYPAETFSNSKIKSSSISSSALSEVDIITLARALEKSAKSDKTWLAVTRFYETSNNSTDSWSTLGVMSAYGKISCDTIMLSSQNGRLFAKIVGKPSLYDSQAALVFARQIAKKVDENPQVKDMVNMTTARIVTELTNPPTRRVATPTYKDNLASVLSRVTKIFSKTFKNKLAG